MWVKQKAKSPNFIIFQYGTGTGNAPSYLLATRFWTKYLWVMKTYPLLQGEKREKIQS
jgi:hypothetical protein